MQHFDIAQMDLNLLVVLDVLLQERSVTRAAQRLGRTQSATSHALGRLRDQLDDPILVRVGGQMRPTPRAERLGPEVARVLGTISRVLSDGTRPFEPATTERVFVVRAPDFVALTLPTMLARMESEAPRATLEIVGAGRDMLRDVADGRCDLAVAPAHLSPVDGVRRTPLARLGWSVYAREDHPAVASWNKRAWARYPHIRVRTSSGSASPVEEVARAEQLQRRAGPVLPHFLLAPPVLAATDMLMTVPTAVLADIAPQFGLVALRCPIRLPAIELALYWSAALERDPAIGWLRALAEEVLRDAFAATR